MVITEVGARVCVFLVGLRVRFVFGLLEGLAEGYLWHSTAEHYHIVWLYCVVVSGNHDLR